VTTTFYEILESFRKINIYFGKLIENWDDIKNIWSDKLDTTQRIFLQHNAIEKHEASS